MIPKTTKFDVDALMETYVQLPFRGANKVQRRAAFVESLPSKEDLSAYELELKLFHNEQLDKRRRATAQCEAFVACDDATESAMADLLALKRETLGNAEMVRLSALIDAVLSMGELCAEREGARAAAASDARFEAVLARRPTPVTSEWLLDYAQESFPRVRTKDRAQWAHEFKRLRS